MTTSLKPQLLALLTRRSHQARENATRDLRQLQAIIATIERAGVMASFALELPAEITTSVPKRLSRLSQLSYVLAVGESVQAKEQGKAILEAAQQQLTGEIESRKRAAHFVQAKIDELNAGYATKKVMLQTNAQKASDSTRSRLFGLKFNGEGLAELFIVGVVGFLLLGLFFLFISSQDPKRGQPDAHMVANAPWWSAFLCCGMPVSVFGGILILVRLLSVFSDWMHNRGVNRRLRRIDRRLQSDSSKLSREFPKNLTALEKQLSSARTSEQKARAALGWLQGECGRW